MAKQVWKDPKKKSRAGPPKKGQLKEVEGASTPKIDLRNAGFSKGDRKAERSRQLDKWAQGK